MPYSEIILGGCALLQGLLLLGPGAKASRFSGLSAFGFFAAALALVLTLVTRAEPMTWFALLEDQPLLRLPRAALFFAALLLGRSIVSTRQIPDGRKPEVLFLLTLLVLFCDLLTLSRHVLLSCILLLSISWLGIFLSGLAYRGRIEGEALLKFWVQASISVALGFGAVLILALISGGAHYDVIALQLKAQAPYSPQALLTILALCLPYFLAGGIFPFHFALLDRDQGVPWAVQLVLGVIVQGAIALSVWKMGVEIFGSSRPGEIAEGMRVLQAAGLAGGFWLAIFALSQENSKRLFSSLMGAQWSAILGAGAMPSVLGVTSITYAFSSVFLWGSMLGFVWSRLQESAGGDGLSNVHGAARVYRVAGLVLLLALAGPLCVPGVSGLPSVLHLLGAMIEQHSLVFLLAETTLLALICLSCLRVGTDLLLRVPKESHSAAGSFRYGALDSGALLLLAVSLLFLGLLWNHVFALLASTAKAFLN